MFTASGSVDFGIKNISTFLWSLLCLKLVLQAVENGIILSENKIMFDLRLKENNVNVNCYITVHFF